MFDEFWIDSVVIYVLYFFFMYLVIFRYVVKIVVCIDFVLNVLVVVELRYMSLIILFVLEFWIGMVS